MSFTGGAKTVMKWGVGAVLALLLAAWLWYDPHGLAHTVTGIGHGAGQGLRVAWDHAADFIR